MRPTKRRHNSVEEENVEVIDVDADIDDTSGVDLEECLRELRSYLCSSGSRQGWRRKSLYPEEEEYLKRLFRQVVLGDVETGERCSTSLIIYGPPGSGKSSIVESMLATVEHEEGPKFADSRVVIRLSASLCPDFRSSVEEIAFQLRRFLQSSSTSESLSSLERLLEEGEANSNDDVLEQTLSLLRASFAESNAALIILLDKIDLFADHPHQRLLYNLFDMTAHASNSTSTSNSKSSSDKSSKFSLCVVGMTCRLDVLELFEKRVKSRFSHRQLNLSSCGNFEKFKEIARRLLSSVQMSKNASIWKEQMTSLFSEVEVVRILRNLHDADSTTRSLASFLYAVVVGADASKGVTVEDFRHVWSRHSLCSRLEVAVDLPTPELIALLGVWKCLQGRGGGALAWTPSAVARQVTTISASYGLSKEDVFKAVERLETLELVVRVAGRGGGLGETYFKSELLHEDFGALWKTHPHVPSSFSALL